MQIDETAKIFFHVQLGTFLRIIRSSFFIIFGIKNYSSTLSSHRPTFSLLLILCQRNGAKIVDRNDDIQPEKHDKALYILRCYIVRGLKFRRIKLQEIQLNGPPPLSIFQRI